MEGFNTELKVGMPALVIGVRDPKNSHIIGKVVTIEALCPAGPIPPEWYDPVFIKAADAPLALVTGLGDRRGHRKNCSTIQQKHLMPLPPLDDDVIIEATKTPKETTKC